MGLSMNTRQIQALDIDAYFFWKKVNWTISDIDQYGYGSSLENTMGDVFEYLCNEMVQRIMQMKRTFQYKDHAVQQTYDAI